jgi:endonuclease V-like protein UPF0215 family
VKLARLLDLDRTVRVVGFDDAPFGRKPGAAVPIAGVVCADTRFEGMLWGRARRDGFNATDAIAAMLDGSKFLDQVRVVLLDGVAVGGFNVIDLPALGARTGLPVVAVMRRAPDLAAVHAAIGRLPSAARRLAVLARAGEIHQLGGFTFQVHGEEPAVTARLLARFTREGRVPEALRIAHLVGAAVMLGQSGRRA